MEFVWIYNKSYKEELDVLKFDIGFVMSEYFSRMINKFSAIGREQQQNIK